LIGGDQRKGRPRERGTRRPLFRVLVLDGA
jgi:hypothetical protein